MFFSLLFPARATDKSAVGALVASAPILISLLLLPSCRDDQIAVAKLYPDIQAPASVDFGDVNVGYWQKSDFQIQNSGQASLTMSQVALGSGSGGNSSRNYFEIISAPGEGVVIPAEGTADVSLKYWAYEDGITVDTLVIESNDPDAPRLELPLTAASVTPIIASSPSTVSFNNVDVGQSSSQALTISNAGKGSIVITEITVDAPDPTEFSVTMPEGFQLLDPIENGYPIEFQVTYSPKDDSSDSGALVFVSNDPATPRLSVSITGNGVPNLPPTVEMVLPTDGQAIYAGTELVMSGTVTDDRDALHSIQVYWSSLTDGELCQTNLAKDDASGTVTCSDTLLTPGNHVIRLLAIDTAGNVTLKERQVLVWNDETPLTYTISGSAESSIYAFTADDNLQIFMDDAVTTEIEETICVNDMDDGDLDTETPKSCTAKYGDLLHVLAYDRYGSAFAVPILYLWYGVNDEWSQPIVAEIISASRSNMEELVSYNPDCEPVPTRSEWVQEYGEEATPPPDCLVYEAWIEITIPPPN